LGRKVHPVGFRIGVIQDWKAKWYADKNYIHYLHEDIKLREAIDKRYADAGVSDVVIERQANKVSVTIHTSRPGIVIGRGGQRVDETRSYMEKLIGKRIQLNIREVQQPELDARLVAKMVAEQIERRVAYRRAMKQAMFRSIQAGAKGIKISCGGRLGGADIARRQTMHEGRVPLQTLRADISYGLAEAKTALSKIGIKVWIYKGEILPESKELEVEETPTEVILDGDGAELIPSAGSGEAVSEMAVAESAEAESTEGDSVEEAVAESAEDDSVEAEKDLEEKDATA